MKSFQFISRKVLYRVLVVLITLSYSNMDLIISSVFVDTDRPEELSVSEVSADF